MKAYSDEHVLGDVLVLGLGKSGKSVVRYLMSLLGTRVSSIFIAAGAQTDDSTAFLGEIAREGAEYAFGDDALIGLDRRFSLCIASPGIPFWHDLYVEGARISQELISEVEFAWRESAADSTWVAITGTNGKTTTTSLAAHVLKRCGFAARAVGNIGDVCLDAVSAGETNVYVAEVSSYQLYSTHQFAPDIAVMLNITPDHIHWHKTLEAYRDAKFSLLRTVMAGAENGIEQQENAAEFPDQVAAAANALTDAKISGKGVQYARRPLAIMDATNDVVRAKVRELKGMGAHYLPLGTADGISGDMRARCGARNAAFVREDGALVVAYHGQEHVLAFADNLKIKGAHNVSNALAAAAIAVALGASDSDISRSLVDFEPLEHRIEPCGTIDGIECYNDSKATNVDATCKALEAFPGRRLIILLGGDDKGTDLSSLVKSVHAHASVAVCFGAAGNRFAEAFEAARLKAPAGFSVLQAAHLQDALDAALAVAEPGDVVLLSPACASFDEFKSFEQRGDVFKGFVQERVAQSEKRG